MSVKKFRFVSPGVFINEIDNSQLPARAAGIGPVVIGRSERGPSMRPVTITSFSEFVEMFGNPIPGGEGGDIWRDGNRTAPTYGAYAAQAYLRSSSPLTFIRLLGHEHEDATAAGAAGWAAEDAYGLFIGSYDDTGAEIVAGAVKTPAVPAVPEVPAAAATASILGGDILLTADVAGAAPNGRTVTTSVVEEDLGAGNPATAAVAIDGDSNITITVTNNTDAASGDLASPVALTKQELVDAINGAPGMFAEASLEVDNADLDPAIAADVDFIDGSDLVPEVPEVPAVLFTEEEAAAEGPDGVADASMDMALAAIVYGTDDDKTIGLSGKDLDDADVSAQTNHFVKLQGTDGEVKFTIDNVNYSVNFNTGSKKYIRKVLNTNPTLTNSDHTRPEGVECYFLGETYDSALPEQLAARDGDGGSEGSRGKDLPGADTGVAILIKLNGHAGKLDKAAQDQGAQGPKTGWVISQHKGSFTDHAVNPSTGEYLSGVTKLFRFEGLDDGAWAGQSLKVEISNIKASNDDFNAYGSFTVTLRKASDSDQAPQYVERYTSVNLNPASTDYIARRIGDMRSEWSYSEGRYKMLGQHPSLSRFIRVVMNEDVDAGVADPDLVPFGFMGPPAPRTCQVSVAEDGTGEIQAMEMSPSDPARGDCALQGLDADPTNTVSGGRGLGLVRFQFPSQACRSDSEQGRLSSGDLASFGATSNDSGAIRPDKSFGELLHPWSANVSNHDGETDIDGHTITRSALRCASTFDLESVLITPPAGLTQADVNAAAGVVEHDVADHVAIVPCFTLDDLVVKPVAIGAGQTKPSQQHVQWRPGARRAGASISVLGDSFKVVADGQDWTSANVKDLSLAEASPEAQGDYKDVLAHGYDSFCMPLVGGCDGVDITQKEPFSEAQLSEGSPETSYAYNSVKRAIDTIRDPEVVECNIATVPGVCNESLTNHLLTVCESRADALAIIDIKGDYQPSTDNTLPERLRLPSVRDAVRNMKDRRLNSSYGCAYFPWVQVRDQISDAILWAPPSVVALGTMSSSQKKTEVWFAPAGFNRGGLTEGSAGLPVPQVRYRLTSKERDALYEANINPIATFPSEGIVIFGQKTLQVTPSALDRINVRRLMIFLKKQVSRIASTILFDPNVETTWQRFTAQVEPFLASVKSRFGLTEFRVILDETTTTPDLVDRNILYAKIMLKPARAIEFIALDFVITRSGASFDD